MITHFKITKLPSSNVVAEIGAELLKEDQLYPVSRQSELRFKRINALEGYYYKDSFQFQAYDENEDRYGNTATSTLEWKENDLGTPLVSMEVDQVMIQDEIIFFLETLPISRSVEFIEVVSITGVNNTSYKGVPIVSGDRLAPVDLMQASFQVEEGGGTPYFEMEYKLGRGTEVDDTIYKFTSNVSVLAGLFIESVENTLYNREDENLIVTEFASSKTTMKLSGGPSFALAKLRFTVDYPWIGTDPDSEAEITILGVPYEITSSNQVIEIEEYTARQGQIPISIYTDFKYTAGNTYTGSVTVELLEINGGTNDISPQNDTVIAQTNIPDEL